MDDISLSAESSEQQQFLTGSAFEPRSVRSITMAAVNDTRNDAYNPRRGSYQRFSAEFAGVLFGGVDFKKYVSDTRRFFPIGRTKVLAMRFMGGTVTGNAPYLEQFLIGGTESLRGFRNDRFVGTRMALLNTELRFPISQNLLGVLFVDVGDAWGGPVASDPAFTDVVHQKLRVASRLRRRRPRQNAHRAAPARPRLQRRGHRNPLRRTAYVLIREAGVPALDSEQERNRVMKRVVIWGALGALIVGLASALPASAAAAEAPKIGVVDMERVAAEYRQMQDLNQQFQEFQRKQEQQLQDEHHPRLLTDSGEAGVRRSVIRGRTDRRE